MFLRAYIRCPGFLEEDRSTQAARVDGQKRRHLEHRQNLLAACTGFERRADMPSGTFGIEIRAGGVDGQSDQFYGLARQNVVLPGVRASRARPLPPMPDPIPAICANACASQGPGARRRSVAAAEEAVLDGHGLFPR